MFWFCFLVMYTMIAVGNLARATQIGRFSFPGNLLGALVWPIALGMAIEEMAWPKEED